jgi:hypothetical protein
VNLHICRQRLDFTAAYVFGLNKLLPPYSIWLQKEKRLQVTNGHNMLPNVKFFHEV